MDELTKTNLIVNNNGISPSLQCSICLDLVMIPTECNTCGKLFCKECIENCLKYSRECPNKHPFSKKIKLDDWIQPALNKIYIKCPFKDCNNQYAYSTWSNHIKVCSNKNRGFKTMSMDTTTPGGDEVFEWKDVQFFVKCINNQTITFMLPLSTTVKELKEKLKDKTGFSVESQRLSVNGKQMADDKMLEYYNVQTNSTIFQLARLKGGK